ncbi:hypothetical protein CH306_26245 [Rhodococcus sp. 15-725-2-2b]|uniref:VOC family protein n=1 Tax=unclassified Rhodococcus (in: high G+C Gram-positive bacteria) TaxID=192944 RepID=UPI000B9A9B1A|nr:MULTISPECIES: VOC family protein [unclassified Rhodococcus (in: high G+C Gram-positive bacteria)]OZC63609.1 hypothetical protein CH277_22415 [Rhodococcus sp. 06-469-3-2]OZD40774.1 hypothetical protein CH264_24100 [Rhodococcus sp. 06-1477-1A]OZE67118.1 hypothetical protein CH306_26245 [Rhodococcus sp. 15-725-2-2b]
MLGEISHIGILVNDLTSSLTCWTELFGYLEVDRIEVPVEGVRSAFVSTGHARGNGTLIELIEPIDPTDETSVITKRLASKGPGVFHIAILADDPAAESARLRAAGLTVIDLPAADSNGPRAVIHPKDADGVLIEILAVNRRGDVVRDCSG